MIRSARIMVSGNLIIECRCSQKCNIHVYQISARFRFAED